MVERRPGGGPRGGELPAGGLEHSRFASRRIQPSWVASQSDRTSPLLSAQTRISVAVVRTDVSRQAQHHGQRYTADQWKVIFMHAAGREVTFIPALDGTTFIPWGQRSSDLTIAEMADVIECMFEWGARNGIEWSDPKLVGSPRGRVAA